MDRDVVPRDVIVQGDALDVLRTLPGACVQTCVTSPPYWNLRDYGVPGQLGLEPTLQEYIERLLAVFAEVRRVLRDDGTLWLNLGDCYANDGKWGGSTGGKHTRDLHGSGSGIGRARRRSGLGPKNLVGLPWRVAFALQADGWVLRSDIIWHKLNPMAESVQDRPTRAHEYVFLFSKRARYYYDAAAIREPASPASIARVSQRTLAQQQGGRKDYGGNRSMRRALERFADKQRGHSRRHAGFNARWDVLSKEEQQAFGANKRDVWALGTRGFSGAHFATFPPSLIEPCILAGSSHRACEVCGAPWRRVVAGTFVAQRDVRDPAKLAKGGRKGMDVSNGWGATPRGVKSIDTLGWEPSCRCPDATGSARSVVLDPFMGSGTTGVVCRRHGRHYLGVELNPAYIEMAEKRIAAERQPQLWTGVA